MHNKNLFESHGLKLESHASEVTECGTKVSRPAAASLNSGSQIPKFSDSLYHTVLLQICICRLWCYYYYYYY